MATLAVAAALHGCGGGGGTPQEAAPSEELTARPAPPRAPVEPLQLVTAPDVNMLGLLDGSGPNASAWPLITQPGKQADLRRLGKALFWDMQVGGDGIQSCASCHYNAGADNRVNHQLSPGLKSGDTLADLRSTNSRLTVADFAPAGQATRGLPRSEAARLAAGATADLADGTPGTLGSKPAASLDVNDVVSSQGIRGGVHQQVRAQRVDEATLLASDPGFNASFTQPGFSTVRRVEPRNSPSVLNAVFNLRNFWDGRADMYFNGVNPFGMRDPKAKVRVRLATGIGEERLDIPFSSLASQAVGPVESHFEMVFGNPPDSPPRPFKELGRKLTLPGVVPLAGQQVAADDSMLGSLRLAGGRGLNKSYAEWIQTIFQPRFWAGQECLAADGTTTADVAVAGQCAPGSYTLLQYNFPLFFGLAVQAYEASLVTDQTIVDLVAGGIATGSVRNGTRVVNIAGLALDGCIASVATNTTAAQQALATNLCTEHYAKFIHPLATTGSESATATFPVPAFSAIGGCSPAPQCTMPAARLTAAKNTLLNVSRGLGRFFAGATGCSICHFNPEFTGATVSTMTGFGMAPELLNTGLARRAELRAVMERMIAFNGAAAVYDTGFYNIGARTTPEDLSLGDAINGIPLGLSKLFEIMQGGDATGFDLATIGTLAAPAPGTIAASLGGLQIPRSPVDLTPIPFPFNVGCGVGLVGGANANNNPTINCLHTVIPGERLLRNGAFKAPGLRNVRFTGPYLHNGSKMNLRQVMEFYKTAGHFSTLNFNNLDAGMRVFNLSAADESSVVELMETGLTDWRVAHQQGVFDHPEICISNGHDTITGRSRLVAIPAVGGTAGSNRIATFEEVLRGSTAGLANGLTDACTVVDAVSTVDALGNSVVTLKPIGDAEGLSALELAYIAP